MPVAGSRNPRIQGSLPDRSTAPSPAFDNLNALAAYVAADQFSNPGSPQESNRAPAIDSITRHFRRWSLAATAPPCRLRVLVEELVLNLQKLIRHCSRPPKQAPQFPPLSRMQADVTLCQASRIGFVSGGSPHAPLAYRAARRRTLPLEASAPSRHRQRQKRSEPLKLSAARR